MASNSYWIDVNHEGLHVYRRITGRDRYVVETKAAAQKAAWNEKWARMQQRERALFTKEQKKDSAARRTQKAVEALTDIDNTLLKALELEILFNWDQLKDRTRFNNPSPSQSAKLAHPDEPSPDSQEYLPNLNLLDRLISSWKQKKVEAARMHFESDLANWKSQVAKVDLQNVKAEADYKENVKKWESDKNAFKAAQEAHNSEIDTHKASYLEKSPDSVVDYCDFVLSNSEYPDSFPKSWQLEYNPETRLLLVEYSLPNMDALPKLKEVKFIATKDEFTESSLSESAFEKMYDALLYKITLRSLHELIIADIADAIDSVVFNGWVRAIDASTGKEINGCILSIQVMKQEFGEINLAKVDPKACFKKLKGIGSSKLAALVPVRPILQLDTKDERFVPSHEVADGLDSSVNLAAMDWEEFEHLIRELFEKEFSSDESEVKITRASRDGGVDAVVFDPDPLRGGKIVIQAKRYTNTVGLSAVRDLYGTVVNEGANKGILVTTADYGPDAYEFAKDKPLALLSGSNLLHLLAKHGHKARIDLREAKQMLQDATN
jgi:restriction system protein